MKLEIPLGELTPEQVEAALREANRPKGTACGTIQSKDLEAKKVK